MTNKTLKSITEVPIQEVHVAILASCLESCVSVELHINGAHSLLQHLLHLHDVTTGCPLHQLFYWIGRLVHLKHVAQQQRNILYEDRVGGERERAKREREQREGEGRQKAAGSIICHLNVVCIRLCV